MLGRTTIGATFLLAGLLVTGRPARSEVARMPDAPPGVRIWTNHEVPTNDGGLALGQAVVGDRLTCA